MIILSDDIETSLPVLRPTLLQSKSNRPYQIIAQDMVKYYKSNKDIFLPLWKGHRQGVLLLEDTHSNKAFKYMMENLAHDVEALPTTDAIIACKVTIGGLIKDKDYSCRYSTLAPGIIAYDPYFRHRLFREYGKTFIKDFNKALKEEGELNVTISNILLVSQGNGFKQKIPETINRILLFNGKKAKRKEVKKRVVDGSKLKKNQGKVGIFANL